MIENQTTEFKREFSEEKIKRAAISFLNSGGGTIYIGIEDNGNVVGVENVDDTMKRTAQCLLNGVRPDCSQFFSISETEMESKKVVCVHVVAGTHRPYYLGEKGMKPNGVFVRIGSASMPAQESVIRDLVKKSDNESFESKVSLRQNLTFDFTQKVFEQKGISFTPTNMKSLGFVNAEGFFTNLALLFSEQCPHSVKCAIFEGKTKAIFRDRKEFSGSILSQAEQVENYLNVYNKISSTIVGFQRVDEREYPESAIREAVVNAIVHRNYDVRGSTLVSLFENRLEILSFGRILETISAEELLLGVSAVRNPGIANVFYRLKFIEAYGTGIPRIMAAYENSPVKPKIEALENSFLVVLPNRKVPAEIPAKTAGTVAFAVAEETPETVEESQAPRKIRLRKKLPYDRTAELFAELKPGQLLTKESAAPLLHVQPPRAYVILEDLVRAGRLKFRKEGKKNVYFL